MLSDGVEVVLVAAWADHGEVAGRFVEGVVKPVWLAVAVTMVSPMRNRRHPLRTTKNSSCAWWMWSGEPAVRGVR